MKCKTYLVAMVGLFALPVVLQAAQYGDFTYTTYGDSVTITKYTGAGGIVTMPAAINGQRVTGIEHHAFNETCVTSIKIPNSVASIGDFAFYGCSLLRSVTIPDSVGYIGYMAFYGCSALAKIEIPDSVASIERLTFSFCYSLTSVVIGENVTSIEEGAFTECRNLQGIYFKGNAPYLGSHVFAFSPNFTVYHLPRTAGWSSTFDGHPVVLWDQKVQDATGVYIGGAGGKERVKTRGNIMFSMISLLVAVGVVATWFFIWKKARLAGEQDICLLDKFKRGVVALLVFIGKKTRLFGNKGRYSMSACDICGKQSGLSSPHQNLGGAEICLECMTCSICGDKATALYQRGSAKSFQLFCQKHKEEAAIIMKKDASEWPNSFINGRIGALTRELNASRQSLLKVQTGSMKARAFCSIFGSAKNQLQWQNLNYGESVIANLTKDANELLENEISSLQAILNERNKGEQTVATPASATSLAAEIEKLAALHRAGTLSSEEFVSAKQKLFQ